MIIKKMLIALIPIAMIVGGSLGYVFYEPADLVERLFANQGGPPVEVTLTIDYQGYQAKANETYERVLPGGSTALDLLNEIAETEMNGYITAINGVHDAWHGGDWPNYWWAFYVNGEMSFIGADSYVLQDGDQILFKYEQPSW